jgi:hypothetical protein
MSVLLAGHHVKEMKEGERRSRLDRHRRTGVFAFSRSNSGAWDYGSRFRGDDERIFIQIPSPPPTAQPARDRKKLRHGEYAVHGGYAVPGGPLRSGLNWREGS